MDSWHETVVTFQFLVIEPFSEVKLLPALICISVLHACYTQLSFFLDSFCKNFEDTYDWNDHYPTLLKTLLWYKRVGKTIQSCSSPPHLSIWNLILFPSLPIAYEVLFFISSHSFLVDFYGLVPTYSFDSILVIYNLLPKSTTFSWETAIPPALEPSIHASQQSNPWSSILRF